MPALKHRLFLTYNSAELVDGAPLYVCSNGSPFQLKKEPAGHSFNEAAKRLLGCLNKVEEDDTSASDKKEKGSSPSVDSYHFKGKKKGKDDGDQQDHYALLGLSHLRFLATEEQIRKSYREVALKHHPDKQAALILQEETEEAKQAKKEETDRHFKAIQEAYEVLIDPAKRRVYDSIDEFDDEVPSECSPEDFFKVFGPVFARNGRWSVAQPVPSLGEDESTMADVDRFYDFWWSFKSWREFPHADEFDLEQAESREHKRWMERQNTKLREKAKKEENGRIRTLIENAYKRDPRIVRRKEEEKAEKLRKKQAKVLAKQEKELEAARLLEEEKLKKEVEDKRIAEEAAAQKKIREKEKKLLRKERSRLRSAAAGVTSRKDFRVSDDSVETLCMSLEMVQLRCICEKLEEKKAVEEQAEMLKDIIKRVDDGTFTIEPSYSGSPPQRATTVESATASTPSSVTEDQPKVSPVKADTGLPNGHVSSTEPGEEVKKSVSALNGVEKKEKPWSKQEVELLRKAVAKYPKGTSQRWEVVANYIGTGRSVDEILKAIKTVLLQKPDSSKAFDSFLQKRKTADVSIASPLSTREDIGDTGVNPNASTPVIANGTGNKEKVEGLANGVAAPEESSSEKKGPADTQPSSNGNASSAPNGTPGAAEQELWSETQELALVKALKTFPKDTAQRWERIAAAVPGKNKSQCFKKFAELRENFRSKKGTD
ncbi:DnaJ homolog subfamily C member 2 [Marchantia polymorpha subsp. ruderalis]|uniref:DnaJ homolog subfamily C member 2-like n=2 Tax=Marchantia polymorpha TaxID=3197 RepID=A0AAF6B714_MARPO|nr:hypothetical protein MARPO_0114s0007 [Marchantia polymorpha]PTQ31178.1 hypothetical protein MARPO_0114s0007 [Marchantia polymorpha]BBN07797.1 hypothetical protein Mp_4g06490 [Marchantia polymorpha subsp. ruderalis]BBN07798.1 hypothetical protein Mp_4g06490 [Marchantia polymorpha subsp. ruderalis]|eukprot:PTQ31177.1 hypothetical protein MARPO_0114s0007 [Marchantia polymorpha]